jgi:hypothetical protein
MRLDFDTAAPLKSANADLLPATLSVRRLDAMWWKATSVTSCAALVHHRLLVHTVALVLKFKRLTSFAGWWGVSFSCGHVFVGLAATC